MRNLNSADDLGDHDHRRLADASSLGIAETHKRENALAIVTRMGRDYRLRARSAQSAGAGNGQTLVSGLNTSISHHS